MDKDTEGVGESFRRVSGIPKFSDKMALFLESAHPQVRESFLGLLASVNEAHTLDYRTKALLRVIVCMVVDHEQGVTSWSRVALKEGWTKDQIVEAMFAVTPQVGFIPVIRMLDQVPNSPED